MNSISVGQEGLRQARVVVEFLSAGLLMLVATLFIWLAWFDDAPPFTTADVETRNLQGQAQSIFRAGETMLVHRELCFLRNMPVQYGRRLVSVDEPKINVFINSESTMLTKGCVDNANVIRIPDWTPTGRRYKFQVVMSYSNNAFQNAAVIFPEPIIEVIK
jgi:hypothetical protein